MLRSFSCILLVLLFSTCATEDLIPIQTPEDNGEPFFELKDETLVLSEETNQNILLFEENRIAYTMGSPQLDSIEVGSILLSRPNSQAAGGFLVRVLEKTTENDRLILETEPATLPDAFVRYRWRFDGVSNTEQGRDDPPVDFTQFSEPIVQTFEFDIPPPNDAWKFVLSVEFNYFLDFASEFDYNLNRTGFSFDPEIENMRLGVEEFRIDGLTFRMEFVREGSADSTVRFETTDFTSLSLDILNIPLGYFPVDPPTNLVWVQPVIALDLTAGYAYAIKLGQSFTFSTPMDDPFQGVLVKNGPGQPFDIEFNVPDRMQIESDIYFNGELSLTAGPKISVGLSPYTSNLLTLGVGAFAGPKFTVDGRARGALAYNTATERYDLIGELAAGAQLDLSYDITAFIDGEFFGFAPEAIDTSLSLLQDDIELWKTGADNSCGFFFAATSAEVECFEGEPKLEVSVIRNSNTMLNVDGTYDVFIDDIEVATGLEPIGTQIIDIPAEIEPGAHTVRLVRDGGDSALGCEDMLNISVLDCAAGESACDPTTAELDAETGQVYCVAQMPFDNRNWFTNNLFFLPAENNQTTCYNGEGQYCNLFGGLYNFGDVFPSVAGTDQSPPTPQGKCPDGYHIPSVQEWLDLFGRGDEPPSTGADGEQEWTLLGVGRLFRSPQTWNTGNGPGTGQNDGPNGFNALAGGFYNESSSSGYSDFGELAGWWTSTTTETTAGTNGAYVVTLDGYTNTVIIEPSVRTAGYSCRCVAD